MKDEPVVDIKPLGSWHPSRKRQWLCDQTHQSPDESNPSVNSQNCGFLKPGGRWHSVKELPYLQLQHFISQCWWNPVLSTNLSFTADKQLLCCCGDTDMGALSLGDVKFDEVIFG